MSNGFHFYISRKVDLGKFPAGTLGTPVGGPSDLRRMKCYDQKVALDHVDIVNQFQASPLDPTLYILPEQEYKAVNIPSDHVMKFEDALVKHFGKERAMGVLWVCEIYTRDLYRYDYPEDDHALAAYCEGFSDALAERR